MAGAPRCLRPGGRLRQPDVQVIVDGHGNERHHKAAYPQDHAHGLGGGGVLDHMDQVEGHHDEVQQDGQEMQGKDQEKGDEEHGHL